MTKVMTIVGTRPEIIRLSETIKLLDAHGRPRAGAHRAELRPLAQRGVLRRSRSSRSRPPPRRRHDSLGRVLGGVLIKTEEVLLDRAP